MELAISPQAVETLQDLAALCQRPNINSDTILVQLRFNKTTGALEQVAPVIRNGKHVRASVQTFDGEWKDVCDVYVETHAAADVNAPDIKVVEATL